MIVPVELIGGSLDGAVIKLRNTVHKWTHMIMDVTTPILPVDEDSRVIQRISNEVIYEMYRITKRVDGRYVGIYTGWEYR